MRPLFPPSPIWVAILLLSTAATASGAGQRLSSNELAPAPAYDSGSGVPGPAEMFTTPNTAVTYRNMEEIFPTRRIAAGDAPSPLRKSPGIQQYLEVRSCTEIRGGDLIPLISEVPAQ